MHKQPFRDAFIIAHRWTFCGWVLVDGSPDKYLLPQIAELDQRFPDANVTIDDILGRRVSASRPKRCRSGTAWGSHWPARARSILPWRLWPARHKVYYEPLNYAKPTWMAWMEAAYVTNSMPYVAGPIPLSMLNEQMLDTGVQAMQVKRE